MVRGSDFGLACKESDVLSHDRLNVEGQQLWRVTAPHTHTHTHTRQRSWNDIACNDGAVGWRMAQKRAGATNGQRASFLPNSSFLNCPCYSLRGRVPGRGVLRSMQCEEYARGTDQDLVLQRRILVDLYDVGHPIERNRLRDHGSRF